MIKSRTSSFFGVAKTARIQPDTLMHPIPDFIAEVLSPSTAVINRVLNCRITLRMAWASIGSSTLRLKVSSSSSRLTANIHK